MSTLPRTPSFRLDGRAAIVTGASRGIGLASAMALAEAGATVTMVARGQSELQLRVDEINNALGGDRAMALVLDVGEVENVEKTLSSVGPFDILVNNAGVSRHRPMLETTADDFDYVTSINFRAAYFVSKAIATGMVGSKRSGSIIHVSSQMGHVGGTDRTVYSATKHAIEGLTKSMAIELGASNIRVNSIGPTFIKTPLTESTFAKPERRAWIESKIKLGRIGELEDIMGAVVFLASDAAALVTGTCLLIDGGWTAG
jgi:NAD(P)-dependent dehydrogenase (short-subunit alcohol dehydrogenase family)